MEKDNDGYKNIKISVKLSVNIENIKKIFDKFPDMIMRQIKLENNPQYDGTLIYLNKMIDSNIMEKLIAEKLMVKSKCPSYDMSNPDYFKYILGISDKDICSHMDKIVEAILNGEVVLFVDGIDKAMVVDLRKIPERSIEEPVVEGVLRGPRDGFTESISTNVALIRKRIKSANLKMENFILGSETKTDVAIMYISNIANLDIVNEIRERITRIDVDAVYGASLIKEYIEDEAIPVVPTTYSTERPDTVVGKLLGGRIAILVDGTPLVVTAPAIFAEFMETPEDFYLNYIYATFNRFIRYFAFILSMVLPGTYIALINFHPELIPTGLLISFIKARAGVPYSSLLECFLMMVVYEILREGGTRMPRVVGQAISVVGALVLGQAAVEAGLVSTPMVIVISTTAIASFVIPSTDMYTATVLPRFIFLFLGGILGEVSLITGIIIFFLKLASIRSFGVPYMEPLAPFIKTEFGDLIMRRPFWSKRKHSSMVTGKKSNKGKPFNRIKWIKNEKKIKEKARNKS